jgi:hypothetical protein
MLRLYLIYSMPAINKMVLDTSYASYLYLAQHPPKNETCLSTTTQADLVTIFKSLNRLYKYTISCNYSHG